MLKQLHLTHAKTLHMTQAKRMAHANNNST